MSTFVIHLIIPTLVAFSVRVFPARTVLRWVWVSVLIDLDYAGWIVHAHDPSLPNVHRALFHNIWITLLLITCAVLAYRNFRATYAGPIAGRLAAFLATRRGSGWVLAAYFHFSHVLLDYFQGGVAFFWPLSSYSFAREFEIDVNTQTQQPILYSQSETIPNVVNVSPLYTWLTSEQFAFMLLVGSAYLAVYLYQRFTSVGPEIPVPGPEAAPPGPRRKA